MPRSIEAAFASGELKNGILPIRQMSETACRPSAAESTRLTILPADDLTVCGSSCPPCAVEHLAEGDKVRTIEELAKWGGIGGLGPLFVGSPSTIADLLQEWVEETDIDGFNLAYALAHDSFAYVIGYVVPELQKHGVCDLPRHDFAVVGYFQSCLSEAPIST